MKEQRLIKYYESVKGELEKEGFTVDTTYRSFNIVDKSGENISSCLTVDGLHSWLAAYNYSKAEAK